MLKLYLALICLGLATQINCENVPAFIFGDKTPAHFPALEHLNGDEFATLIKSQATKDTLTVVFVEEKLSVEDFSQCRLKTKTCFENLNNIEHKSYLSSISKPVDSLLNAFSKQKSITVSSDIDLKDARVDGEKILFVYFDEVENAEDFYKHDALINKLYNQLKKENGNIVAIYTGIHPSFKYSETLSRKIREAKAAPAEEKPVSENTIEEPKAAEEPKPTTQKPKQLDEEVEEKNQTVYKDDTNKLAIVALTELKINNETFSGDAIKLEAVRVSETEITVTLSSGAHKLAMQTQISGGTWFVNFIYNDNDESKERFVPFEGVYAFGVRHSYGCVDLKIENSKKTHLIRLINFQYMPFFETPENLIFPNYVNDCTGFFSPPIWGALFVVILLLSILTWGLYMMMDIRTMDRFDDPKGKTITINAQD